jgi:hypothetical protein
MARIVETQQTKKKSKLKSFLITILVIGLLVGGGFTLWKFVFDKEEKKTITEVKELDNLKDYGYVLTDRDSEYFKKEFEALKKIVNQDEVVIEEYTSQVAKMFVTDLYTLNNKVNKYDIGGNEYFHIAQRTMFEQKVIDTLYSSLLDNTYGDRKQQLPEVSDVEILSNTESTYTIGNTNAKAYVITLNINYVTDMGYDDEATVTVCQEGDSVRWSVVDFQPQIKE